MPDPGQQLDWTFDPLEALRRWPADQRVMMLHSGRPHERWARRTIMALPTGTYRFDPRGAGGRGHGQWLGPTIGQIGPALFGVKPFRDLRTLMKLAGDGLWIGYLSYDLGRWVEDLPSLATDDRGWPVIELAYCPGYLDYDLMTKQWRACGSWAVDTARDIEAAAYTPRADDARRGRRGYNDAMPFDLASLPPLEGAFHASDPQSIFSRPRYEAAVAVAQHQSRCRRDFTTSPRTRIAGVLRMDSVKRSDGFAPSSSFPPIAPVALSRSATARKLPGCIGSVVPDRVFWVWRERRRRRAARPTASARR
jgi:anthranilate/para-aminobenzoate synthase component I